LIRKQEEEEEEEKSFLLCLTFNDRHEFISLFLSGPSMAFS
jgi:hypothetical protein